MALKYDWRKYKDRYDAYKLTDKGKEVRKRSAEKYRRSDHGKRKYRDLHLMKQYGMTSDRYKEILESQDGCCAICGGVNKDSKPLYVDHSHNTGEIRGLLCMQCNASIGQAGDNTYRLMKMVEYLLERGE